MVQLDGGAEHAPHGRDDAELDPVAATDPDQLHEDRLVDCLGSKDDAIDPAKPPLELVELLDGEVGAFGEDACVDVVEELAAFVASRPRARPFRR